MKIRNSDTPRASNGGVVDGANTRVKSDIEGQLQAARQRLLDLTGRNRLLNYRPSKRRTIHVIDEIPKEVFDILVLQEKVMQFKPADKPTEELSLPDDVETEQLPWLQDIDPAEHHIDRLLQTGLAREELKKRQYYIHQQAQSVFEEQGHSILYLALGYLEWNESKNAEQLNPAPLILIPVELERQKVRTRFNLRWSGAELYPNLSLEAKLAEQGVELPLLVTPEDKTDIDIYFQAVTDAVAEQENWRVVPDIYLDFFSFTKFVMYKDLEPDKWSIDAHPLLGSILGDSTNTTTSGDSGFEPAEIDLKLPSQNLYHVMDADSSQIVVIEEIKNGKNLVVEGPPGTGKSQTIANAIAELLAAGKKVLFVSEKMAALEVVKGRLDSVGLGNFCLELHSHKSNKRAVLNELERTVSAPPPPAIRTGGTFVQLDSLKAELNAYVSKLHEPIGKTRKSPFVLFGIRETAQRHFESVKRDMLPIRFVNPAEYTSDDWTTAKQCLAELVAILPSVTPVVNNPWRGCKPDIVTPPYLEDTKALIGTCVTALDALEKAIHDLADACAIHIPTTLEALPSALVGANVMAKALPIEREVLLNKAWDHPGEEVPMLIGQIETVQKKLIGAYTKFNIDLLARAAEASRDLEGTIHSLVDACAVQPIGTPKHFQGMLSAAGVMAKSIPVEPEVLLNEAWNRPNPEAEKLIQQVETVREVLTNVLTNFNPSVLDRDISSLRDEYKDLCGIFPPLRFFNREYRSIKLEIRGFYKEKPPQKIEQILGSLEELAHCINLRKEIRALEQIGRSLFGLYWKAEESDPNQLRQFVEWIVAFRKELLDGTLTDRAVDIASEGVASAHLINLITQAKTQYTDFVEQRDTLLCRLDIDSKTMFGLEAENVSFIELTSHLEMWQTELPLFNSWMSFVHGNIDEQPQKPEQLTADLAKSSECTDLRKKIRNLERTGLDLFGRYWRGENSNLKRLREFKEWIVKFRKQLIEDVLTEQAVDIVGVGVDQEQIEHLAKQVETAKIRFVQQRDALCNHLGTDANALFRVGAEKVPFAELRSRLELWERELTRLQMWRSFVKQYEECQRTIAQPLLSSIANDMLEPQDILPCFEGKLADALLGEAFRERTPLDDFDCVSHEGTIANFRKLDTDNIKLNRQRLASRLHQKLPYLLGGASRESEIGILQGQFNRKRGHMPIRKLLSTVGRLIQQIKPCFMMSPLSVAQFCDSERIQFDVVVFDEASQIRPEDALGALLRGEQAVVIGDTKQLPPTSFFEHLIDTTGDEAEDDFTTSIADVESILHQCRQSFPTKQLKWHYRSRHESLIAVSNQEFYENNLLIFPSPFEQVAHLGLKFVHLPDAVYDRGRSSTNRKEARAVVHAVFEHYRHYPDKSLGIGTFNMKQQQAILDEVEVQLHQHPEMEPFFLSTRDEHFFVKNLETIQGDERDVIFLSMGYGKDASGKLHRNFGPLNHEGGQRRLNVLTTRARERCIVFSNFRASDLQLNVDAPVGARALKVFLDYAENRNLRTDMPIGDDTDSPFEDAVREFLTSHGYTVNTQVGCTGYRIDLAVVNPAAPGRYLIGIECDGARYHSSPVARDRDRLRQQVLEGLGWTLHRVWSTDWYRNRAETGQRLLEAVERAKFALPEEAPAVPEPEPVTVSPEPETSVLPKPSSSVDDYVVCADLGVLVYGGLHAQPPSQLAKAISRVVEIESPVHIDEVMLRIRNLWGLGRAGARIKNAIEAGVSSAQGNRRIRRVGDFLWTVDERDIPIRRRHKPKIEWICDEEIAEAMKLVITIQGGIPRDALIAESVKLFGYKSVRNVAVQRMKPILDKLVKTNTFQILSNGMVYLI